MRAYVPWINETPVGAIELFLGTDAAGVHGLNVPQAWQGRGVASALLEHVCCDASDSGHSRLVLLASSDGQRLYARRGFREVGRIGSDTGTAVFSGIASSRRRVRLDVFDRSARGLKSSG